MAEATARRTWLESLTAKPRPAAIVFFVLAAALAGAAIWLGSTYAWPMAPLWIWGGAMAIAFLTGGIWLTLFDPNQERPLDSVRLFVLTIGGVIGLLTVLLAVVLGYLWWNDIKAMTQAGGPAPDLVGEARRLAVWRAVLPLPILIVGMGIAFASLLLARTDERSNVYLRRLLYGYNAVVQGLLAVLIIVVANVFVSMKFSKPLDFTGATFYTLSPTSETLLGKLEKPVKVIVVLEPNSVLMSMVKPMLANCQAVNPKLEVEYFSNDPNKDITRIEELRKKYPDMDEGLLVVYGDDAKAEHKMIKSKDMIGADPMSRDGRGFEFKGEDALMTEIDFLVMDRKKTIVYFTQGHGELDIGDNQLYNPQLLERGQRIVVLDNRGSGILKERLEKRNMEVKGLPLTGLKPEVPKDADVVAILGPKKSYSEGALKALDEYMARKGKLIVMTTVSEAPGGGVQTTGIEEFLMRYNVQVPAEVIFTAKSRDPAMLIAELNPRAEKNPLVSRFVGSKPFMMRLVRPLRPGGGPPGMTPFSAEPILLADRGMFPWVERDLATPVSALIREMSRNEALAERKLTPGQENPYVVAVAVSEGSRPPNPHMGMMQPPPPPGEETPRLVVFGSVTMASNARTSDVVDATDFDYMASSIDWLRGKTVTIGIKPKKNSVFSLGPTLQQPGNYWAFVLLPTLVICLGIIGTGTGVWLVRRR